MRVKKASILCLWILMSMIIMGCDPKIKGTLHVQDIKDTNLIVQNTDNDNVKIKPGKYSYKLFIDISGAKRSKMIIYLSDSFLSSDSVTIKMQMPKARTLLQIKSDLIIPPEKLGQPFGMHIKRVPKKEKDKFIISFRNEKSKVLAKTEFLYSNSKEMYNADNLTFLKSYQEVRRSHRAMVYAIASEAGTKIGLGEFGNHVVDYGAMIYIAPWIYLRYSKVAWFLGKKYSSKEMDDKWSEVLQNYPVVDYFSNVHTGSQFFFASSLDRLSKKKNQLRLVYTGACDSGASKEFITKYNAAVAIGHKATSASPYFQFSLARNWVYGYSVFRSVKNAWLTGRIYSRISTALTFAPLWEKATNKFLLWDSIGHMIDSSELLISYTKEIDPAYLAITHSAVPERNTYENRQVYVIPAGADSSKVANIASSE